MSAEHLSPKHEQNERSNELEAARAEKLAELQTNRTEKDPADTGEKRAEQAREAIKQQELKHDTEPEPATPAESKSAAPILPFLDHHLNYVQTIASVQRKLSPVSRSFSKVIHTPVIEQVSEKLETTVARPSVLLGTTWTALIVGTIFYLTARHYGYALSGSELLFSFIVGGLLGLVVEGLWRTLKRR